MNCLVKVLKIRDLFLYVSNVLSLFCMLDFGRIRFLLFVVKIYVIVNLILGRRLEFCVIKGIDLILWKFDF